MRKFKEKLKVVYVGPLNSSGTCYSRLRALKDIEPDVYSFDSTIYFDNINKIQRALEYRLFVGPQIKKANVNLLSFCNKITPDIVWVDKGYWLWPSTLKTLKHQGIFLVHHNTDALYPTKLIIRWMYLLLRRNAPLYHMHFTTNIQDFSILSNNKSFQTELTFLGYDHFRFNNDPLPIELPDKPNHSLVFVGHYEKRTELYIKALVESKLPVIVYGHGWKDAKYIKILKPNLPLQVLNDQDYVNVLKRAKIGLCFVSEINGNQTAGRSFEITACGTFLLAMRTHQHLECYVEDKEAVFFKDSNELVKKAEYYLNNDNLRNEIAKRGHDRVITSDYSWAKFMREDWRKVKDTFNSSRLKQTEIRS